MFKEFFPGASIGGVADVRFLRTVRLLVAVAAALLVFPLASGAESYTYQGHTLKYTVPPGYCLMDRQGVIGSITYSIMEKAAGQDAEFIAAYLNCDELTALMATHTSPVLHGGAIAIPKSGGSILLMESETRADEINRLSAKFSAIDLAWVNDQVKQRGQERGVVFPELKDTRLIARDSVAAYATLMSAGDDKHPSMMTVMAMSLTNQLPFITVMIAPASDQNAVQNLLDNQRRFVTWLISLNETEDEQRKQSQTTPGLFDSSGGSTVGSSVALGVLCLVSTIWLLYRMRQS